MGPNCGGSVCDWDFVDADVAKPFFTVLKPEKRKGFFCCTQGAEIILNEHNRLRRLVAAGDGGGTANDCSLPAGTIPDLVWDDSLALGAQLYINYDY